MDVRKLVSVDHISYKYSDEDNYALDDVSLSVFEGEWLAIVGHNGSGKSTLARILNGIIIPEQGKVTIQNIVLSEDNIWEVRSKIGMVFQNPDNQFVGSTVKDDIAFGLENNGVQRDEMILRIDEAIQQVKMEEFTESEPHQLSGGQKQRVAIAGVLAAKPHLIILDEATSMLDPKGREELLETIRKMKESYHITVLSITHDLEEASKADRVIVMKQGKVYAEGTPEEIFSLGDKLISIGLDLPFSIKLSKELIQAGIPLTKNYLTEEGLVNELWRLYSKN